jgi:hypothetical protein
MAGDAVADTSIRDIPPGEDRIQVLREGDKAPYTGQLFDSNTAMRWANWIFQYKFRLKADVEYEKNKCAIDADYFKKVHILERDKYTSVTTDYQNRMAQQQDTINTLQIEIRHPPFFKTVWFGFIAGALLTGAAVSVGYLLAH